MRSKVRNKKKVARLGPVPGSTNSDGIWIILALHGTFVRLIHLKIGMLSICSQSSLSGSDSSHYNWNQWNYKPATCGVIAIAMVPAPCKTI